MKPLRSLLPVLFVLTLPLALAAGEIARTSGLLAEGTEWENPYYIAESSAEGPTLMVIGGLHGNEPAGARAADQIRRWTIGRGRLIVVPRANTPGLKQNTRWLPGEDKATRNANRNFPATDEPNEARTEPVRALWEFLQQQRPDWVVDLHEGYDFHVSNPKSVGSSIIYFDSPEMHVLAERMQTDVNDTVSDPDRKIVRLPKGPINGGLVRAAVERLDARGFVLETTRNKQPLSTRTRQHRMMVHRLMRELDMAPGDVNVLTSAGDAGRIRVAVYDAGGTGGSGVQNLQRILEADPGYVLHHVGPPEIRDGVLSQFDVVIFPGGSGSKEAAAIGEAGRGAVRRFVESGGGYVGICAGAYLATAKYDWGLGLLDARTFTGRRHIPGVGEKSMWYRGRADVQVELTEQGRAILGELKVPAIRYVNGPILSPAEVEELPDYVPLAIFRSEISRYEPQKGTMINTPAIIAGPFGSGRAMAISPHPEAVEGLEAFVRRAVSWAAGEDRPSTPERVRVAE